MARLRASAFGEDACPNGHAKVAALLQSIARKRALVDGNGRSARRSRLSSSRCCGAAWRQTAEPGAAVARTAGQARHAGGAQEGCLVVRRCFARCKPAAAMSSASFQELDVAVRWTNGDPQAANRSPPVCRGRCVSRPIDEPEPVPDVLKVGGEVGGHLDDPGHRRLIVTPSRCTTGLSISMTNRT